jgi:eukaryotic-like serine/threonine-protein kinase
LSKGGYHLWKTTYDARGNPLESAFFDTEERPVTDRDSGVHRISRVRDELGRIVEEAYFGADGKPALHKKGYHKLTALYDERGNKIEERYFGLYDRPFLSKSGFHVSKASYDVRGNHIVWACFDTEERPMLSRDSGLHRISRVRDDLGRLVEEAYLILTTNRRSKKTSITN